MLRNVKDAWVRSMVQQRDDVVLIDAAILGPPQVFEASGHLSNFSDPLVDCTVCNRRFREDQLEARDCPQKMKGCTFTEARAFNLMFQTHAGPVEGEGATVYMRPETAQGMFVNFANVLQTSRKKPPFGIAQVGKSFRNEITPGNFIFRTREFEQMEMGPDVMAMFPFDHAMAGCSGALVKGPDYEPCSKGTMVYFEIPEVTAVLTRVTHAGGKVLVEKTSIGEYGYIGVFLDSEGNKIGLHSAP